MDEIEKFVFKIWCLKEPSTVSSIDQVNVPTIVSNPPTETVIDSPRKPITTPPTGKMMSNWINVNKKIVIISSHCISC